MGNIKTPNERWEEGIAHHPLSDQIVRAIVEIDFEHNDDYFNFKIGGDGDNGEELMYLFDIFFDSEEGKRFCEIVEKKANEYKDKSESQFPD